jgi:hypothetical protein
MIEVKILSCRPAQRYAVRQRVIAGKRDLQNEYPGLELAITEVKDWVHIESYTLILSAPSLVVNEGLVCEGRFPTRQEVLDWLRYAVKDDQP